MLALKSGLSPPEDVSRLLIFALDCLVFEMNHFDVFSFTYDYRKPPKWPYSSIRDDLVSLVSTFVCVGWE